MDRRALRPCPVLRDPGINLSFIRMILPLPPSSRHNPGLSALPPHDDLDRLSRLPDALLRNVVSRLPFPDAARTTELSSRWRGVWHSAPLVVVGGSSHLPAGTKDDGLQPAAGRRFTAAVSGVLAAHPGPFSCFHLNTMCMGEFPGGLLASWLQILAAKGVQELVLFNPRPSRFDLSLSPALFGMASLTRLYLALCKFPNTARVRCAAPFPNLRELGLCTVVLESRHMDFILAGTPVLEILHLQGNLFMDRLTIVSHSLRCVQLTDVSDLEITVKDAPRLERLIIWLTRKGPRKIIKIGCAPALSLLGYLEPEVHVLHVGSTIIKAGTRDPSTLIPTVKILGLKVRCGVLNDAKFVSSYLRCFPNVETLHIQSKNTVENTGKLNLKFWEESATIDCIRSRIKLIIFRNFGGHECELSFLKFFLESARMLEKLLIVYTRASFASLSEVNSTVKPLFSTKWASNCCSLQLIECAVSEDEGLGMLTFKNGGNFNVQDPFAAIVRV